MDANGLAYNYSRRLKPLPFCISQKINSKILSSLFLTDKLPMSLGGKLINKKDFLILERTHDLKIGEDAFLTLQLMTRIESISFVNIPIYIYSQRDGSVMNNPSKQAIASRVCFVKRVISYFSNVEYWEDEKFQIALSVFILNQYYAISVMGRMGVYWKI